MRRTASQIIRSLEMRVARLERQATNSVKETWRVKNSVRSQDDVLDEIDSDCFRAGLKCRPYVEGGRRMVTIEGSPSEIEKVMSRAMWKNKLEKI